LVQENLWEKVDGGYQIHDFLSFNKSKAEITAINKSRAENGAKPKRVAKQIASDLISKPDSEQVPIIPNPLSLIPKKELKDSTTTTNGAVFQLYESEIGVLTSSIAESIKSARSDYSDEWIVEAIKEAVKNNKRSWSYALAILARWKKDGFKVDTRSKQPANHNGHKPASHQGITLEEARKLYLQSKGA
jgi:DnaD/phage-associated family protein